MLTTLLCLSLSLGAQDFDAARQALLEGVESLPKVGTPGTCAVFGPQAFVVLASRSSDPVAAAAEYGEGRIFAIAHEGFLGHMDKDDGAGVLLHNVVRWLAHDKQDSSVANVSSDRTSWSDHDVLVLRSGQGLGAAGEEALRQWVADGGGLILAACPWGKAQILRIDIRDGLVENRIMAPMGIVFAMGYGTPQVGQADLDALNAGTTLERVLSDPAQGPSAAALRALEQAASALPAGDPILLPKLRAFARDHTGQPPTQAAPLTNKQWRDRLWVRLRSRFESGLEAQTIRAAEGSEQFPGPVPEDAPRQSHTLYLQALPVGWQSTGLYLAPGEILRIGAETSALRGWTLRVGCHTDKLWGLDRWTRWPDITRAFALGEGTGEIATPHGGLLYLEAGKGAGDLKLTLHGVVLAPLYVRDDPASAASWESRRRAPAPWAELVGEHIILSVPSTIVRELDDPDAVIAYWDRVVSSHCELAARPTPTRPERFVADLQISAGYMHAGYPIMTWMDVVTAKEGRPAPLLDLDRLTTKGNWGYFHELGHNFQRSWWTFRGTGEVTNNLFSLHAGEVMAGIEPWHNPWLEGQKRGGAAYLEAGADFSQWKGKPGVALLTYAMLQREFGWEPFHQVFAGYEQDSDGERPASDDERIAQWVIRFSLQVERDLRPFFQRWGWPVPTDPRLDGLSPFAGDFAWLEEVGDSR